MEINKIRDLIASNKISDAFLILQENVSDELQNDVILLNSQFQEWERKNILNLGVPIEERNRIVYATLHIVSQVEKRTKIGLEAKRLQSLIYVESELVKGYEKLVSLKNNGAIDLFMIWLTNRHPETFMKLIDQENTHGKAMCFTEEISKLDLKQFATEYNLNANPQRIYEYIINKINKFPNYFTGWLEYKNYRENYANDLSLEIEKYKIKHQNLLKTGIIGAMIGAATFSIFDKTIDKIIELHDSGITEDSDSSLDADYDND